MKRNLKTKRISTFKLKQQFVYLLAREFKNCGLDIVLGFESSFKNRICTLKFVSAKRVELCVNLGYVKKSVCIVGVSQMFKVRYCALFVAEYIKQIEQAKNSLPQGYFEGLAFLNAIDVCKAKKTVSVYSPLLHWNKSPKPSYCLRPLEISSAINALNKIKLFNLSELTEQENSAVNNFCDSLLLYAGLPEVSYNHTKAPVYALVDSFKRLASLIAGEPEVIREFPILALAPFERIEQLSVNDLFLHCIQSENEFLTGISIRLIAFLNPSLNIKVNDEVYKRLVESMNKYIDYSLLYCKEVLESGRCLKTDNLYAIKTAVKSINDCLNINGTDVNSGNIHSII